MPLLDYLQAKKMLDRYGIRSVESRYVSSAQEALAFARGKRIVLKLISGKALHKSKAGLVKLDLESEKEIGDAFNELARKGKKLRPYKIQAQKMAESGVEVIIGGNTDPQFGKMILVGLGGIYVEAFHDVQLRLCPLTKKEAVAMLSELHSAKVVTHEGKSTEKLAELLVKTSKLLAENKKVRELDLNPVIVREDSYDVVDIRMLV